jgi:hypothetical protein
VFLVDLKIKGRLHIFEENKGPFQKHMAAMEFKFPAKKKMKSQG